MARISDLLIGNPNINSFVQLEQLVAAAARAGEVHLFMDIKPEFPDTPRKWETELEIAFYRAEAQRHE